MLQAVWQLGRCTVREVFDVFVAPEGLRKGMLVVVVALASTGACKRRAEGDADEKPQTSHRMQPDGSIRISDAERAALDLVVAAAAEGDLPNAVMRFGRTSAPPDQEALVVSPVPGRVPRAPLVQLGATVAANDELLLVTPVLSSAERVSLGIQGADLAGQIKTSIDELALREVEAARARDLAASSIVSKAKLQEAETAVATTKARLEALRRAKGVQAGGESASVALRAPVAGTLVALNANVGAIVQPGDVLARILRAGPRWVDLALPPDDPAGLAYEVQAGDAWIAARLLARGALVEGDGARHDRIEVPAEQAAALLPGSTVAVRVARDAGHGVLTSASSIVPGVGSDLVYVETSHGVFAARAVHVAARFDGKVRMSDGLRSGELIVTRGAMALRGEAMRAQLGGAE